ncbi:hypothetical protein BO78DRAFT_421484 [Aspergillus sclerotiicarbonarius CBS 121057]|uniref:Uncharacterized protein n=1 Tax=Aspergillus sclerotiicarbonarius (strain CBS 121057 / IBT 28362) TaxID=1448318 RepID=A0A319EIK7_ASPSB|nr:hypothetical protein BO78DRAFT_421484 [Aspergillus sclerotiicarbonarius CBS 121057]
MPLISGRLTFIALWGRVKLPSTADKVDAIAGLSLSEGDIHFARVPLSFVLLFHLFHSYPPFLTLYSPTLPEHGLLSPTPLHPHPTCSRFTSLQRRLTRRVPVSVTGASPLTNQQNVVTPPGGPAIVSTMSSSDTNTMMPKPVTQVDKRPGSGIDDSPETKKANIEKQHEEKIKKGDSSPIRFLPPPYNLCLPGLDDYIAGDFPAPCPSITELMAPTQCVGVTIHQQWLKQDGVYYNLNREPVFLRIDSHTLYRLIDVAEKLATDYLDDLCTKSTATKKQMAAWRSNRRQWEAALLKKYGRWPEEEMDKVLAIEEYLESTPVCLLEFSGYTTKGNKMLAFGHQNEKGSLWLQIAETVIDTTVTLVKVQAAINEAETRAGQEKAAENEKALVSAMAKTAADDDDEFLLLDSSSKTMSADSTPTGYEDIFWRLDETNPLLFVVADDYYKRVLARYSREYFGIPHSPAGSIELSPYYHFLYVPFHFLVET